MRSSIVLACLLFCATSQAQAGEALPDSVFSRASEALAERWHRSEGDSLIIDPSGNARFVDRTGKTVLAAKIAILSWLPAVSRGPDVVHVLTLAFDRDGVTCVVPGYFTAGEGESPGLDLMCVPAPLAWDLRKSLQLEGDVLSYNGPSPP